jgi:hypothetical protein
MNHLAPPPLVLGPWDSKDLGLKRCICFPAQAKTQTIGNRQGKSKEFSFCGKFFFNKKKEWHAAFTFSCMTIANILVSALILAAALKLQQPQSLRSATDLDLRGGAAEAGHAGHLTVLNNATRAKGTLRAGHAAVTKCRS